MTTLTSRTATRNSSGEAEIGTVAAHAPEASGRSALTTSMSSPIGQLTLVSDGTHLTGVYMENHSPAPRGQADWRRDPRPFGEVIRQLQAYFAGDLDRFDLPLRVAGTAFQQKVWQALGGIPFGTTLTYGELAKAIGQPSASRAVGLANGRNPISIVVPCHRVIGSGGALTGYAGGVARKRWLLRHEGIGPCDDAAAAQPDLL